MSIWLSACGLLLPSPPAAMGEVVELRRMFGLPDYMIRVQVADLASYERWLTTRLLGDPAIAPVDSRITMKLVKAQR